ALRVADAVAEVSVAPAQAPLDVLGIGLDQQLVRIEAMAARRIIESVNPVAIEKARASLGQIAVPDLVRSLAHFDPLPFVPPARVEHAQLHAGRVGGKEGEIYPFAVE